MTTAYKIRQTYSFQVYPVSIIGNDFASATLLAIMDSDSAAKAGLDVYGMHAQIYSFLPTATIDDPTQYTYLKFKLTSGQETILAVEWIDDASVVAIVSSTIIVTILNTSADQAANIRNALVANGYSQLTIAVQTAS